MPDEADDLKDLSPLSSSSEGDSIPEEDIDQLIRDSRQVLRESAQVSVDDLEVPYKYTKEQAIAKLSQIADNFNIKKLGSVAGLGRSGFQLRDGQRCLVLQDSDSESSEDELVVVNQPKRTLPSFSHLLMRKELRRKAKRMALEKHCKYGTKDTKNELDMTEQQEHSSRSEESDVECEEGQWNETNSVKDNMESNHLDTSANKPDELYVVHTRKTFGTTGKSSQARNVSIE